MKFVALLHDRYTQTDSGISTRYKIASAREHTLTQFGILLMKIHRNSVGQSELKDIAPTVII